MKRSSTVPLAQRGATVTGYGLLLSAIVAMSMGAIQAVNRSAETVLTDAALSVGSPMPPKEEVLATPVPKNPSAAPTRTPTPQTPPAKKDPFSKPYQAPDPSFGIPMPFNADDYSPKVQGDAKWGGSAANKDLTSAAHKSDRDVFVFLENVVAMTKPWTPPTGGADGDSEPIAANPGDLICSYLVHGSPASKSNVKYNFKLKIEGEIIGTAYNSNFDTGDNIFAAYGATYPADNNLDFDQDSYSIKHKDKGTDEFKGDALKTNLGDYDQIRIFVRCGPN